MKETYVTPNAETIFMEIEMGLLTVTGGDDPIHEGVMDHDPDDYHIAH